MNKQHEKMGTEKVSKLLFSFSLPAVAGMMVNALYNIVDRIYIGTIEKRITSDSSNVVSCM